MTDGRSRALTRVGPVALGLALVGVAAYGILAIAARSLSPERYAAVASTYFLITIAGTGVFTAVEQESNRAMSARGGDRRAESDALGATAVVAAALAAVVGGLVLVTARWWSGRVLLGSGVLEVCVVLGVVGAASLSVLRGAYGATQRYGWYATTVAGEGLGRLIPMAVLVGLGVLSAETIGFAFAVGTALATVAAVAGLRGRWPTWPGRRGVGEVATGVMLLVGASTLTFLIANMGPVVLTARLSADPSTAATFASAAVLARVPVFLFSPAQAFLLPPLTAAAESCDGRRLRKSLRDVVVVVSSVGLLGVVGAAVLGPWVLAVGFAAPVALTRSVLAALAAGTALMLVAQVVQPALVALRMHRAATVAWGVGAVIFLGFLIVPTDPFMGAVVAQVAGPLATSAAMGGALVLRLRRQDMQPSPAGT